MTQRGLLARTSVFLNSRFKKEPTGHKQITKDWRASLYTKKVLIYGAKRSPKDLNVLATITSPSPSKIVIKPTKNITPEDLELIVSEIKSWGPAIDLSVEE